MWKVTTNKSSVPPSARNNGFVTGDWEVITASQAQWSKQKFPVRQQQILPVSEIDELVEALGNLGKLKTEDDSPAPIAMVSHVVKRSMATADSSTSAEKILPTKNSDQISNTGKVIDELAIPRQANSLEPSPLSPKIREQLLKLRATIMVEAEQRQLRSVLICGAAPEVNAQPMAADLSRFLAEYKRLKIAYIEIAEADTLVPQNPDYTFRIRRTRMTNLYEITSSQGAVRLDAWLKNWTPTVVLGELKKMFDLVLIYAPAVTRNPEVALLAGAVDGVILAATENVTPFTSLGEAHRRLHAAQAKVLGVTLNKAPVLPSPLSVVKSRMRGLMNFIAVIK